MIRFEDLLDKSPGLQCRTRDLELLRRALRLLGPRAQGAGPRSPGEPYLVHPLEVAAHPRRHEARRGRDRRRPPPRRGRGHPDHRPSGSRSCSARRSPTWSKGVTKISAIPFSSSEERQAENFRKMLLAMVDDIRVILVKLADRLHNMRTLQLPARGPARSGSPRRRSTSTRRSPTASGMSQGQERARGAVASSYLEPEALRRRSRPGRAPRARPARALVEELRRTIVERSSTDAQVPVVEIDGRIKRLYSIHQKLQPAADRPRAGLRLRRPSAIVTDSGEGLLRGARHHPPDLAAGAGPHQGLHRHAAARTATSRSTRRSSADEGVPFEVQIRTEEMHRIAEEGIAAHWKYKEGPRRRRATTSAYFAWLRQLLEWQQEVRDPQEFIQNLKVDLYPEEVYAFTPKGEVKSLPRGATPIDFAYAIHTDVGAPVRRARKVNGKMVPLRTRLKNGDIVEIVTQPKHKPSRDWLNFVVTSQARNKIKHFLDGRGEGAGRRARAQAPGEGAPPLRPQR
ncbi:MAG: TGS domain-containing protein [Candidatus Moduliflexus flocculans]|nr:TGS domain-containing protein [Candidatus Moduliflexus flocculans]